MKEKLNFLLEWKWVYDSVGHSGEKTDLIKMNVIIRN